jgi:uncharacterized protein YgiM (DUF1202 family)
MLRIVRVALVGALLLVGALTFGIRSASADFDTNDVVVVTTDFLNLRSDAGTDGRVITTLGNGMRLLVTDGPRADDGYVWYRVTVLGDSDEEPLRGWVAEDFIALEGSSDGGFDSAAWVRVIDGPLNVREVPGVSNDILTVADEGDSFEVIASSDLIESGGFTWINVVYTSAQSGWIATDFLEALSREPDDSSGDTGFEGALGVAVVDGPVNVRRAPGLDQTVVTTLDTGAEVPINGGASAVVVSEDGFDWVAVLVGNGIRGYMAIDYLSPLDYSPNLGSDDSLLLLEQAGAAIVTDGPLNLRAEPGTSGDILLTLEEGDYLWLAQPVSDYAETVEGHTWVLVDVAGETGWVAIDFIDPAA